MDRCTYTFEPSGHRCCYDIHGDEQPHSATPTGESITEYSQITPVEALDFPYLDAVMLGGSMTLDGAAKYLQSTGRPAPVALYISAKLHEVLHRSGLLAVLMFDNPTIAEVRQCPELDDTDGGHALIFAADDPIDARRALLVYAGKGS